MMEESDSSRIQIHYFSSNETRDSPCKREKGEGLHCQFILECRARPLEDLINSISALINTRLTEFRPKMITLINKNGGQPMSLGDRNSYFLSFIYYKF